LLTRVVVDDIADIGVESTRRPDLASGVARAASGTSDGTSTGGKGDE